MPIRNDHPTLIRIVEGVSGNVSVASTAKFRFDYGKMTPWITMSKSGIIAHVGPDKLDLRGFDDPEIDNGTIRSCLLVREGKRHVFMLTYGAAHEEIAEPGDPQEELHATQHYWRDWIGRFERQVPYREQVKRSLLTLKALIHRPTGGLVAAPTTSLPELPGGNMNWDYRFCWLRDATFTLRALVECNFIDEAAEWRDWILRSVAGAPDKMQIMYRVDGSRRLDEAELEWLPGYGFAKPVRIGNAAAGQVQLDVYGELINMLHHSKKAGMSPTEQGRAVEKAIIEHLEEVWTDPDHGIWESRGEPRHYVASKVLAWVAFDRFLSGNGDAEISPAERQRLTGVRDHIHTVICCEGYNEGLGTFTSFFGGNTFDASLLLLPKLGFLPMSDERMSGTVAMIETNLLQDGFVRRHQTHAVNPEGAFLACCFWLAECQLLDGRRDDAVRTIEQAMSIASNTGLMSEEYDPSAKRLNGNYPQALSHLALISAVLALDAYDQK